MYLVFGTQLVKIKLKYNPLPKCTFVNVSFLFHKLFKILYCFIYGAFQISIRDPMWPPHGDQLLNTLRTANRHIMRTFNLTEVNLKRWYLFLKQRRLFFLKAVCTTFYHWNKDFFFLCKDEYRKITIWLCKFFFGGLKITRKYFSGVI